MTLTTEPSPEAVRAPSILAAIDLGTNSFHLVVARDTVDGRFEVMTTEKDVIRLGHGGGDMKDLSDDAIDRGIAALARMRRIAESAGAPVRAVATSAVREAENADVFIQRARAEAGVEVEVISGVEEARLIHLGVLQAVPVFDQRLLLCDIGGGSTEVLLGQRGETLDARSFKLGAVRLTDRFFRSPDAEHTKPSSGSVAACRSFVRSTLAVFEREVAQRGFEVAVGSSGTIEAVARLADALDGGGELGTYNCYVLTRGQLRRVVDALIAAKGIAARRKLPGAEPDRADIIVAGALVLEGVFDTFGIDSMMFSEYALREGVLLDTVQRMFGGTLHHLREVSRRSVRHLAELCDDDPDHSAHVADLALQLFDQTRDLHGLDDAAREYLEAGALLANVGLFVSHSKHHLHSYYVIRNTEHLTGFTDTEIEIIALLARYHRKSAPKPSHVEFMRLERDDRELVRALAGMLRVAFGFDRSHDGRVAALLVNPVDRQALEIEAVAVGKADLSLERYAANERRGLLEDVLGRQLLVR
jgi:exopolyphosphatase/guanosine-5'-triphosphate,3'-diphosphate pyrophosphatase